MTDVEPGAEVFEVLVVELPSVVGDDGVRQSEPEDDGLLDEVLHLPLGDLRQGLGLDPLREVVDGDNDELPLARRRWKWAENIDSPLSEGPRGDNRSDLACGSVLYVGVLLAWFVLSDQLSCILSHGGPVVTLPQDLVG